MWDLPELRIEPTSPALAGRFFATEPPASLDSFFFFLSIKKVELETVVQGDEWLKSLHEQLQNQDWRLCFMTQNSAWQQLVC